MVSASTKLIVLQTVATRFSSEKSIDGAIFDVSLYAVDNLLFVVALRELDGSSLQSNRYALVGQLRYAVNTVAVMQAFVSKADPIFS